MLKPGQIVYTVRGDTNGIDQWKYEATFNTPDGKKCILRRGKQSCIVPRNCVFTTVEKAAEIAGLHK